MKTFSFPPLLRSSALLLVLCAPAFAQPSAPQKANKAVLAMPPQAGFYRFKIGDLNVTALSDGTIPIPLHQLLLGAKPGQITHDLAHDALSDPTETSVNAYLIEIGSRRILIDCGAGILYGPTLGTLTGSLQAAGVRPDQITDVLLTHIHTDHSGGLMNGKALAFPNALVHVDKRDVAHWLSAANLQKASPSNRRLYLEARQTVAPVLKAGKIRAFDGDTVLFPGLRSLTAYGHTPGHTVYVLESRGQKLMFWGDMMHAAAVQFPDPNVTIKFDSDPKQAAATRKYFLLDAAKKGYWVAFDHVNFPGIGHVRAEGKGYRWIPINYSDDGMGQ